MFVISTQSGRMFKQHQLLSKYKAAVGFFAALNWVLVFLAASFAGPALAANHAHDQFSRSVITPITPISASAGIVDPAQLPEDNETVEEDGIDETDDDKHTSFFDVYFQQNPAYFLQQLQQVKCISFQLAVRQPERIALFVLHHSWKAHLI